MIDKCTTRGGVEDERLEAKAKDTKKSEAKAKDLSFKAKDFKMCPRGRPRCQGRPRGLHLCAPPHAIQAIE